MTKLYCKIINENVTDPQPLPDSFKTKEDIWITGFNHLSSKEVLPYGFYEFVMPEVKYNKESQDVRYHEHVLNLDKKTVSPRYEIIPKPVIVPANNVVSNFNQNDLNLIDSLLNSNAPAKPLKNI